MDHTRTHEGFERGGRTSAALRAALVALLLLLAPSVARPLIITEVMFNPNQFGSDDGLEWVELYNDGSATIDLADYSLGWGGADYTTGTLDLDPLSLVAPGSLLDPGAYFVIGGPSSPLDFNPDLEDGFIFADGVALFDVPAASIGGATPIDALIYATGFGFNINGLIDETGTAGAVDATIGAAGQTAARDASGNWTTSTTPTPGSGPLPPPSVPEPSTGLLIGLGLLALAGRRASQAAA
jgi:hypothetical protein